jgi:hypothetical protein
MPTKIWLYFFFGDGVFLTTSYVCLTNIHESYHAKNEFPLLNTIAIVMRLVVKSIHYPLLSFIYTIIYVSAFNFKTKTNKSFLC